MELLFEQFRLNSIIQDHSQLVFFAGKPNVAAKVQFLKRDKKCLFRLKLAFKQKVVFSAGEQAVFIAIRACFVLVFKCSFFY